MALSYDQLMALKSTGQKYSYTDREVMLYAGEARKFLYGSDWPICSMKSYVAFMRQLGLSAADYQAMMYENARQLFRLPLPPLGTEAANGP